MTRPPEYEQVAQWLRAINGGPELLQELASEYRGIKYAIEDGLTLTRYIAERRQSLAEAGWRALGGIDLDGKSTAQMTGEYHARQIAQCAHLIRDLEERIRALESGDFAVPAWCAQEAARDDTSLADAIERYRQGEIYAAARALDCLDEYAVTAREIQAYWAGCDGLADAATGSTGLPWRTSLDFPNPVTQGVPACPASPRRPAHQPGWPAARRTP